MPLIFEKRLDSLSPSGLSGTLYVESLGKPSRARDALYFKVLDSLWRQGPSCQNCVSHGDLVYEEQQPLLDLGSEGSKLD